MDKIEKIRKEIERRLKKAEYEMTKASGISHDNFIIHQAESNLCRFLLDFLDTLTEEPNREKLVEEARKYTKKNTCYNPDPDLLCSSTKDAFIAVAKRQYQKDRGEFAKIKAKTWCEGFDACKEQLMKEAVEGEIVDSGFDDGTAILKAIVPDRRYDSGDTVRIIVLPKED